MKRLQTLFLGLLIVCSGFGQTVLRSGNTILRAYDSQQPLHIDDPCALWLDGRDDQSFTLDGTSVDQWDDKSGNDRHVLNGTPDATRPTYDINTGRVTFTASSSAFLQSAAFGPLTQPNTIFVVYKITGGVGDNEVVFDGESTLHAIWYQSNNFLLYAGAQVTDGATNVNDNIHIALFNGASSEYWINGISKASGNVGANDLDGVTLGAINTLGGQYADCEISEVIIFNADISDVDRDKITGYLGWKWDITATTDFKGYVLTTE